MDIAGQCLMKALQTQEVMNIARMRGEDMSASVALCQYL